MLSVAKLGMSLSVTSFMGNWYAMKIIQVFQPTTIFNLHVMAEEKKMGVLEHCIAMMPGIGQTMELVKKTKWNLIEEARLLPPFDECLTPNHWLVMNIIVWNCRGALNPEFQNHVRELVQNHNPAMLIVMETRVGGDRTKEIMDRLPFDEAIHTETIGYTSGLWLLWNSDRVVVTSLATIEQEIHVSIKVRPSNSQCLLTDVYASPRFNERCVLWNNLLNVASLHNSPWIIVRDFNEVLVDNDKFGGKAVNANRSLLFKDCLDSCNMVDLGFSGPRFTWSNRRRVRSLIQERLDRFFANTNW